MSLTDILPEPIHTTNDIHPAQDAPLYPDVKQLIKVSTHVPPYGKRHGWTPRTVEDFGDGGAFPELHVAQYPLDMGRKIEDTNNSIVPITIDKQGETRFDSIMTYGRREGVVVHTKIHSTKEKVFTEDELMKPSEDDVQKTVERTKRQLQDKTKRNIKSSYSGYGNKNVQVETNSKYIRYTPGNTNNSFNSGSDTRLIRMVDIPKDPLDPPKFKHKKIPMGPSSPPVPILHSPTKKLTKEERDLWRIPPCISNWKNNKGYMIPLDKRVASDGRGLQEPVISDTFSKLSQALYSAERNARELVAKRAALRRKLQLSEQEQREEELRKAAAEARLRRMQISDIALENETDIETKKRIEREKNKRRKEKRTRTRTQIRK